MTAAHDGNKVLPFFKSHYSIGKSILTVDKAGSSTSDGPTSIIDLVKDNQLKHAFLVEENMSSFLDVFKNFQAIKVPFFYGLRLELCPNIEEKSEESINRSSKIIIFAKNGEGYKNLIKIFTIASTAGFYYVPRIDEKNLSQLWNENNLKLCIPFYDSFIFKNVMTYSICCPEFAFAKPTFVIENNNLPFDLILKNRVEEYAKNQYEIFESQSIYYENKEDFLAYLTFKCISQRTTLNKPELEHCSSNEFCAEAFKEKYGK